MRDAKEQPILNAAIVKIKTLSVYEIMMENRIHQRSAEGFAEVGSVCAETGFESYRKDIGASLPPPDGIGKPLGNHDSSRLIGFYKISLRIWDTGWYMI